MSNLGSKTKWIYWINWKNTKQSNKNSKTFKGPRREQGAENFYKESKIDKVRNIVIIANCRFIYDQLPTKKASRKF